MKKQKQSYKQLEQSYLQVQKESKTFILQ